MGLEEIKKEHGLDSREVILLLLLTQKLMIVQVTAPEPGWLQRKTEIFLNYYENTYLFAPNTTYTLDNFPNFSLIYLATKTCQTSFFITALIFFCHFNVLCYYFRIKLFNNYCTIYLFQNNFRKKNLNQAKSSWGLVVLCDKLKNRKMWSFHMFSFFIKIQPTCSLI